MTPDQFQAWLRIEDYRMLDHVAKMIEEVRAALIRLESESTCTFTAKDIELLRKMKIVLPNN